MSENTTEFLFSFFFNLILFQFQVGLTTRNWVFIKKKKKPTIFISANFDPTEEKVLRGRLVKRGQKSSWL